MTSVPFRRFWGIVTFVQCVDDRVHLLADDGTWPPTDSATSVGGQSGDNAFLNQCPLKLCESAEHEEARFTFLR